MLPATSTVDSTVPLAGSTFETLASVPLPVNAIPSAGSNAMPCIGPTSTCEVTLPVDASTINSRLLAVCAAKTR
jgi:hypothetical protein